MLQLPTIENIITLEKITHSNYPDQYKEYLKNTSIFPYSKIYSEDALFVDELKKMQNFYSETKYTYSEFLIFFIDQKNNDYYGFLPNSKVSVFSDHTFVKDWEDFHEWIQWNEQTLSNTV